METPRLLPQKIFAARTEGQPSPAHESFGVTLRNAKQLPATNEARASLLRFLAGRKQDVTLERLSYVAFTGTNRNG